MRPIKIINNFTKKSIPVFKKPSKVFSSAIITEQNVPFRSFCKSCSSPPAGQKQTSIHILLQTLSSKSCRIAAMRNDEHGKIHELFLDWSSVPPRAPDDVVLLDAPLSAVDNEVWASHEGELNGSLRQ